MFNTPILDIVLGLVFIFLLYSLLATSVKEAIASGLGLRARMLRRGIIEAMLTDTPDHSRLTSLLKGVIDYIKEAWVMVRGRFWQDKQGLGYQFYQHPLMKNYGSNKLFSHPSYLAPGNFCMVLIETLKKDLENKIDAVAKRLLPAADVARGAGGAGVGAGAAANAGGDAAARAAADVARVAALEAYKTQLLNSADIVQIRALLDYYAKYYDDKAKGVVAEAEGGLAQVEKNEKGFVAWIKTVMGYRPTLTEAQLKALPAIGPETLELLRLHLTKSLYNIDDFGTRLTHWFDDTMDRVSGWYKRQVQVILLIIGFVMAFMFNVDVIDITTRLSKDDKLRDKLVQSAVAYSNAHGQLPGGGADTGKAKGAGTTGGASGGAANKAVGDTAAERQYRADVKAKFDRVDSMVDHDIRDVNTLLALGYGDYGRTDTAFLHDLQDKLWWWPFGYHKTKNKYAAVALDAVVLADCFKGTNGVYGVWYDSAKGCVKDSLLFAEAALRFKFLSDSVLHRDPKHTLSPQQVDSVVASALPGLINRRFYEWEVKEYPVQVKTAYMLFVLTHTKRKWLGFLLLGLAVCMGAPFWFDMLSKVVNLRAAGKKEGDGDNGKGKGDQKGGGTQPVVVNINNQPGNEEAVG